MKIVLLAIAVLSVVVPDVVHVQGQTPAADNLEDIPTTAINNGSFTTLVAALGAADLVPALSGDGPFTVFAPTDDAFAALPAALVPCLLLPENKDALTSILTYHVANGDVASSDLTDGQVIPTLLDGQDVTVKIMMDDGTVMINDAHVVLPDVDTTNGVVHAIDAVLVPPAVDVTAFLATCPAVNAADASADASTDIDDLAVTEPTASDGITLEDDAGTTAASPSEDAATSDPEDPCIANEDCAAGEYCSTVDGTCYMNGQCASNEDCDNVGNLFAAVMCVGTMYCVEGAAGLPRTCSNICDGTPTECSAYEACAELDGACCPDEEGEFLTCCQGIPNVEEVSPPASAECSAYEACAELEGTCCPDKEGEFLSCCSEELPPASAECSAFEACAELEGACCPDKEGEFLSCCSEASPPAPDEVEVDVVVVVEEDAPITPSFASCDSLNDCNTCLVASNTCVWQPVAGCLASCAVQDTSCYASQYFGNETIEEICDIAAADNGSGSFVFAVVSPVDPEFAVDSPVDPGFGVDPPIDPGFGVDPAQSCESDTDCEADKEYCGQGTCISKGMCIVDEDCMNTANDQYADKKCRGYKFCNEFKECDRMCGEPCPGGTGAEETECTVTGCDTKILCPNSVSCTPDYCQDCKGMYFDPMGMVIEGCGVTITDDGADAPTSADAPQDGSTSVSSPPTSATENDEEKEEKQNDKKDDEEKEEKQNDKKDDEEKEEKQNDKKNDEEKEEKGDAAAAAATTTMTTDETTVIEPTGTTASADTTSADPSSTGEVIGEGTTYVSGSVSIVGLGRTVGSVAIVVLVTITAVLSL